MLQSIIKMFTLNWIWQWGGVTCLKGIDKKPFSYVRKYDKRSLSSSNSTDLYLLAGIPTTIGELEGED